MGRTEGVDVLRMGARWTAVLASCMNLPSITAIKQYNIINIHRNVLSPPPPTLPFLKQPYKQSSSSVRCAPFLNRNPSVIIILLLQMQQDYYMYQHSSRFTGSLTGQPQYGNRYNQPFEMNTSTQHRQFHQMKAEMPSDVLELFKANQIKFLKAPVKPKCRPLDPVTTTIKDIPSMFDVPNENLMEREKGETRDEKRERIARERQQRNAHRIELQMQEWNPFADEQINSDPEKTLVVARMSYKTTQKTLKYEFEKYGIIKSVRVVRDQDGKSRGYGFVEFDNKEDFVTAYKNANYRKIDGHKIIVDYERGRALLRWRPRRFAGGKGYLRLTRQEAEKLDKEERERRARHDHEERQRSRSARRHERKQRKGSREKKDKKQRKEKKEKSHRHRDYDDQ